MKEASLCNTWRPLLKTITNQHTEEWSPVPMNTSSNHPTFKGQGTLQRDQKDFKEQQVCWEILSSSLSEVTPMKSYQQGCPNVRWTRTPVSTPTAQWEATSLQMHTENNRQLSKAWGRRGDPPQERACLLVIQCQSTLKTGKEHYYTNRGGCIWDYMCACVDIYVPVYTGVCIWLCVYF